MFTTHHSLVTKFCFVFFCTCLLTDLFFFISDLTKDEYTLGRNADCDICFSEEKSEIKLVKHYQIISKVHCIITREVINNKNDVVIFIQDMSSNGTFVNRKLVGKANKIALDHEDVISFARPENAGIIFIYKFKFFFYGLRVIFWLE